MRRGIYKRRGLKYQGRNRRYPTNSMANRMLAVMNCVENHYKDFENAETLISTAAVSTSKIFSMLADTFSSGAFAIATGATVDTRTGNKIFLKKLVLKGRAWSSGKDTQNGTSNIWMAGFRVRLILAWDNQPNGAKPTAITDILTTDEPKGWYAREKISRFKIIKDKTLNLKPIAKGGFTSQYVVNEWVASRDFFFKCNLHNTPITYVSGGTGGITELKTKNLVLFATAEGVNNTTYLQFQGRLEWTD